MMGLVSTFILPGRRSKDTTPSPKPTSSEEDRLSTEPYGDRDVPVVPEVVTQSGGS